MDKKELTSKVIQVMGSTYEDAFLDRFTFEDHWRDDPSYIYDGFIDALIEHNEGNREVTFKALLIEKISDRMESLGMIQSYEDKARALIQACHDELFSPDEFCDGEIPEYRYVIAEMPEDELVELLADAIKDEDPSSFEDEVQNMNVKVRFMYSPKYVGIDESLNYGSHIGNFRCDENLETALRFFNILPSELKQLMESRGYEASEEFKQLAAFKPKDVSIATKERVVDLLENTSRYWIPGCIFNVSICDLLDFAPGKNITVEGGTVCCFDIYNGSGHDESMEDGCQLTFELSNPAELLNCSDGSRLGQLHDRVFGVVKSVFNAEITISD